MPTTPLTTTTQPRFYEVQPGDTLFDIAKAHGLPVEAIMQANGMTDANVLLAGQVIQLRWRRSTPRPRCRGRPRSHLDGPPSGTDARSPDLPHVTSFWPRSDHWSVKIPLDTPHRRLPQLAERGFVVLDDADFMVPQSEYLALEYMDWKSGGDTNFAPIASADGELDCGFWDKGKTDKDALWTSNAAPCHRSSGTSTASAQLRSRAIKLEPQQRDEAIRSVHRDDNNRFNPDDEGWVVRSWLELTDYPDSYMLLMDSDPEDCPIPPPRSAFRCIVAPGSSSTRSGCGTSWSTRVTPPVTRFITSFESGDALEAWIDHERPRVTV